MKRFIVLGFVALVCAASTSSFAGSCDEKQVVLDVGSPTLDEATGLTFDFGHQPDFVAILVDPVNVPSVMEDKKFVATIDVVLPLINIEERIRGPTFSENVVFRLCRF